MNTKVLPRCVQWARVEKTWSAGSAHCIRCPHRVELSSTDDAISAQGCALLAAGAGDDFLKCPGFAAPDLADVHEERARTGFLVALQPAARDMLDTPAPILIGSAYVRPMDEITPTASRLQAALMEPRTARPVHGLQWVAQQIWRFC